MASRQTRRKITRRIVKTYYSNGKSRRVTQMLPYPAIRKRSPSQESVSTPNDAHFIPPSAEDTQFVSMSTEDPVLEYSTEKTHTQQQLKKLNNWDVMLPHFVQACKDNLCPFSSDLPQCLICKESVDTPVRCNECFHGALYCEDCFITRHKELPFHCPETWKSSVFVPGQLSVPSITNSHTSCCQSNFPYLIEVTCNSGKQITVQILCCKCESPSVTLIRHGLWPATPIQPKLAFTFEFMEWLRCLRLRAHASTHKFSEAVKSKLSNGPFNLLKGDFYRQLLQCRKQFVEFKEQQRLPDLPQGCPACPTANSPEQFSPTFSLDGCFGLYRRLSAGKQLTIPKLGSKYFVKKEDLDIFWRDYDYRHNDKSMECHSDFQAGTVLRGQRKNTKLDEKALFGAICRHEIPKLFCNITHNGERLGYAVYLVKKIADQYPGQKINILYDVACKMKAHLKRYDNDPEYGELQSRINLATPIFHSYAHSLDCQMTYSPRYSEGFGLSDGEGTERLWADIRPLAGATKLMLPENRIDALSEALDSYGTRNTKKLVKTLCTRFEKAQKTAEESAAYLREMEAKGYQADNIRQKHKDLCEDESAAQGSKKTSRNNLSYHLMLHRYYQTRQQSNSADNPVSGKLQSMNKWLKKQEKAHSISRPRESSKVFQDRLAVEADTLRKRVIRHVKKHILDGKHLMTLMNQNSAGSQDVFKQVNKALQTNNKKKERFIGEYNQYADCPSQEGFVTILDKDEIASQESRIWTVGNKHSMNPEERQVLLHACLLDRCREEDQLIPREIANILHTYTTVHQKLTYNLEHIKVLSNTFRAELSLTLIEVEMFLESAQSCVKSLSFASKLEFPALTFRSKIDMYPLNHVQIDEIDDFTQEEAEDTDKDESSDEDEEDLAHRILHGELIEVYGKDNDLKDVLNSLGY